MVDNKESILVGYPNIISYECSKKIIEQMEKNICKIKIGNEQGTGFFCKIPFPDMNNMLSVLITNNHVINEKILNIKDYNIEIDIKIENNIKKLNLNNRIKYTNKEYDITIIEIKKNEINNYLELDDNIINDIINNNNYNKEYIDETIYIIQYPENKLSVSYGILDKILLDKNYNFNHKYSTKGGSSGSPILNINNNKIIGIHKEGNYNNSNKGLFLNFPIKEFIKLYTGNNLKKYENNIKEFNNNSIQEYSNNNLQEFNKKYNLNIQQNTNEINLKIYVK